MTDRPTDPFENAEHPVHGEHDERGAGRPVVRDKRRIDPVTGEVRPGAGPAGGEDAPAGGEDAPAGEPIGATTAEQPSRPGQQPGGYPPEVAELEAQVAERTADLQRVSAEYANYRRRVDRDREAVRELAAVSVLIELLPVLDDIDRAREHDELVGGFKSVAERLEAVLGKLGLQRFGEPGDPFDPTVHEAMTHAYSPDVETTVCVQVFQPGFKLGERVVRPARVAVAEPDPDSGPAEGALGGDGTDAAQE